MNDAEIAFQICMNDLLCFGERQFTEREHRPDDTSFEIGEGKITSLSYSDNVCWCEHFSSPSTLSQCDAGGVSGVCSTLMLVTPIVGVL